MFYFGAVLKMKNDGQMLFSLDKLDNMINYFIKLDYLHTSIENKEP